MDSKLRDKTTMEHKEIITDELIAKYISGKTTEEEDNLIHDYLAQHPEFANDLLDIATALRHQRKHDEATGQVDQEQPQEAKRIPLIRRRTFYYVAASVVVIIGIGLVWFKPFAQSDTEQSLADADTEITYTNPTNGIEGNDLNLTDITAVDSQSEEPMLADNQEAVTTPVQENPVQPQLEEPLLANNNTSGTTQQQETAAPMNDDNASTMAALTESEGYNNYPTQKDAIFVTDMMPTNCNPAKDLVMKWTCNSPSLKLEISTDNGKTWEPQGDISNQNSKIIGTGTLIDFKIDNPEGFNWRITAQYRDRKLVRQGTIRFTDGNK